ncbi:molybdopterin molybdotransferase MoeA [Zunongwangia atlantica]|uniref:Molybdopterin molybdenumtransferase n=1 Tax=Zunongwangia atlantica 22II14-10F7 TaxID=1185767 RepID=A0A1Y1SZC0_9FLAO|nr:molybdopterin molybdotransferase MoeA [Zunongwangia atlantica]ORL44111.1 molybdopterin biosynthesis MoeA protein [Zunongwangia atlantica 22II14-10F7]
MISHPEALQKVLATITNFGTEKVALLESVNRILAEDIFADRDFPPFDRVTKDGIAVNSKALENGKTSFKIEAVYAAGSPQGILKDPENCVEIMTGAMLPKNCDSVIMYEDIEIENGIATLQTEVKAKVNIHRQGSDRQSGEKILSKNQRISAIEIGVLATVGKAEVMVKKLPKIAIISTGDELVDVAETPLPHQIRTSNTLSLFAALEQEKITPTLLHIRDEKKVMLQQVENAINNHDVLLLSGGVSKGKFDYLPEILEELKVEKLFHRVLQRPGKPLWFGKQHEKNVTVFSFPGNPNSTFVNFHIYFERWLAASLELETSTSEVILKTDIANNPKITRYLLVKTKAENGQFQAELLNENGSGDLISLANADGVIMLPPEKDFKQGDVVEFIKF